MQNIINNNKNKNLHNIIKICSTTLKNNAKKTPFLGVWIALRVISHRFKLINCRNRFDRMYLWTGKSMQKNF